MEVEEDEYQKTIEDLKHRLQHAKWTIENLETLRTTYNPKDACKLLRDRVKRLISDRQTHFSHDISFCDREIFEILEELKKGVDKLDI